MKATATEFPRIDALMRLTLYGTAAYIVMWDVVEDDYIGAIAGAVAWVILRIASKFRKGNSGEHERIGV